MSAMATREQVGAARLRLEAAAVHRAELEAALTRGKPTSAASVRRLRKVSFALGACACGVLGLIAVQRPPEPPAPALYWKRPADPFTRRGELTSELERETEKLRVLRAAAESGPAQIPADAYPGHVAVRKALGNGREAVLAWAHIGVAACTVRQEDVARAAYAKLNAQSIWAGPSDGGMPPGISAALRDLDERCREYGIHLLVPVRP